MLKKVAVAYFEEHLFLGGMDEKYQDIECRSLGCGSGLNTGLPLQHDHYFRCVLGADVFKD
jgi:hypothetical protein